VQFEGIDFNNEDVGSRLQQYYEWARETIGRYSGPNSRLNRVLTGDKGNQLHIIFGAPVAPDSPGQAVRCALTLLREKPSFITSQRIGLAVGKVFACPVGSEERREYTVVGDVVNLSARLTQVCPDNSLVIDGTALDRCRGWLEYETLPPVQLKGKQELVPLYRAIGEQKIINRLQAYLSRWQRPLIGREEELAILMESLKSALARTGCAVAITGALGIGKSRLLVEGGRYWLAQGGQVLMGDSQPHTRETPFGPWLEIWRDFFEIRPEMANDIEAEKITTRIKALYPEATDTDCRLWCEVLGVVVESESGGTDTTGQLPAEVRQARLFNLVRQCFQTAAQSTPIFLALEDIHWADQASLDLIDFLADYLQEMAVFVSVTFRPSDELPLELLNRPICTSITLVDLPPDKAQEMVQSLLGISELPHSVERHLGLRDREGLSSPVNPLFLEEALRVMLEKGVISVNGRLWVNEIRLQEMQVPDSIHGLLLARLDGLPAASRDVLQIASVIGRQFALDILSRITPGQPDEGLVELLNGLSVAELVQLIHADPELTYLFQHAMTREVAYESLPYARRQALHAAIAGWVVERYSENLRPYYPTLAYHYSQTEMYEEGLQYSLAAAEEARDIFANREAVESYKVAERHLKALGEDKRWETAVQIYLDRGEVYKLLGDFAAATADVESALKLLDADGRLGHWAKAYNLLADIRYRQGDYIETKGLTERIFAEDKGEDFASEMARAYFWYGMASAALMDYDHAILYLKKAEEISLAINDKDGLSGALEALAFIHYSRQELRQALVVMQRGAVIKRDFATPTKYGIALNNVALIQSSLGQAEAALETWNQAVTIAEDTSRNVLAIILSNRAEILAYLGRFDEAERDFERAVNLFMVMDDAYSLAITHLLWGYEFCVAQKQWQAARFHFDEAFKTFDFESDNYPEERPRLLIGLGCLELGLGTAEKAAELFESALEIVSEKGLQWWLPTVTYYTGLVHFENGAAGKAQQYFAKAVEAVSQRGCPDYLPQALLGLAMVEADPEKKRGLLAECVRTAEERARFVDRMHCLEVAGELLKGLD
jgi:tetratricopeptide (TPR) repeat protein